MNSIVNQKIRFVWGIGLALMLLGAIGCGSTEQPPEKAPTPTVSTDTTKPTVATQPSDNVKPTEETKPAEIAKPVETPTATTPTAVATPETKPAEPKPAETKVAVSKSTETSAAPVVEIKQQVDYSSLLFVFMLATFIGLGVILRVSRLLHTPLMSLTNAISAIAVVGSIIVVGEEGNPWGIRLIGAIALFASMTNIISGFLITDRMLKMFKSPGAGGKR